VVVVVSSFVFTIFASFSSTWLLSALRLLLADVRVDMSLSESANDIMSSRRSEMTNEI
jgi:hypothetical protein